MRQAALFTALAAILTLMSGCAGPAATPTPTPWIIVMTATPNEAGPVEGEQLPAGVTPYPPDLLTGPCENLLWPLRDSARWTYSLTDPSGTREVTLESRAADGGLTLLLNGASASLNCLEGAIAGLPPTPLAGHPALGTGLIGVNPIGELLPDAGMLIPLGTPQTWDVEMDAAGMVLLPDAGSTPLPVTGGKIVIVSSTSPLAPITTLAGSFNTLPITQQGFFDLAVTRPDGTADRALITTGTQLYFSEGVGLVKVAFTGGSISTPGGVYPLEAGLNLELTAVQIP
ncbi:MAG: hypothetical protein Kow00124_06440 [Anaerolineae bacterium]